MMKISTCPMAPKIVVENLILWGNSRLLGVEVCGKKQIKKWRRLNYFDYYFIVEEQPQSTTA